MTAHRLQCIHRQQLPDQFVDEQPRYLIGLGYPRDLAVHAQTQKRLHGNGDASDMINIGPSHEFHGGQFLLFLGWYFTSTLEGEEHKFKELFSGI
jgi:hypothetical protein